MPLIPHLKRIPKGVSEKKIAAKKSEPVRLFEMLHDNEIRMSFKT